MHKIIALWAVPRSTSTAFEWMMRQRGDLDCLHEPFGEAWYQGEDPFWPRFREGDKTTPGLTINSVWQDIQSRAAKGSVFLKDFPHYINHMWTPEFLSKFTHAFLIRDPAKTLTSLFDKWPDFDELEVGFPEQRALFDLLTALNGAPPPVIDSDDLLEDPARMTQAFCAAVGIPFLPQALSWQPGGDPSAHSWWDGGFSREPCAIHRADPAAAPLCRTQRRPRACPPCPPPDAPALRPSLPAPPHLKEHAMSAFDEDLFLKGLEQRKATLGADYVEKNLAAADDFTRPFQEAMTAWCWGFGWGDDVIDPKTRSMMNLAMIGALGKMAEWETHCRGAISNGVSQDEIRAIIHVIGIYCGVPQALECFRVARKVLAEDVRTPPKT